MVLRQEERRAEDVFMDQRWRQGCHNAAELWHELRGARFLRPEWYRAKLAVPTLWPSFRTRPACSQAASNEIIAATGLG